MRSAIIDMLLSAFAAEPPLGGDGVIDQEGEKDPLCAFNLPASLSHSSPGCFLEVSGWLRFHSVRTSTRRTLLFGLLPSRFRLTALRAIMAHYLRPSGGGIFGAKL